MPAASPLPSSMLAMAFACAAKLGIESVDGGGKPLCGKGKAPGSLAEGCMNGRCSGEGGGGGKPLLSSAQSLWGVLSLSASRWM
eukprot:CAMPEP_0178451308 /NCGR_PEP_ID=MMETSP0689_2-20121128/43610_1 /TAXON_ID=160604 /ORGANISM="Amphidinium massartii, Strain CS-259" /LENGTH=83 /DNA_ID=CAMNT_0020076875 /DNA_START=66 /DNA_END=317 /DNA_ORIENTATION=+